MRLEALIGLLYLFVAITSPGASATESLTTDTLPHNESPYNSQRQLQLNFGSGLTRAPSSAPPDSKTAEANYTYFLYTDLPPSQIDQALDEVHVYVQTRFQASLNDLLGGVELSFMRDKALPEGCPDTRDASVPTGYTSCSMYRTSIGAIMGRQWDVDIFARTSVQAIKNYLDEYNQQEQKSAFVVYNDPIQVRTETTLLLVGARQLMTIYEYSFLASVLQISALDRRALANENPPFTITDVKYVWQRVVPRQGPSSADGIRGRQRNLQVDLPPLSVQVHMLIVATCAGTECTDENLSNFVQTTIPEVDDEFFENVKKWSETNYFRSGAITEIVLDTEDQNPTFIDAPELPPESNYSTPGVLEEETPIWTWLSLLIAGGTVFLACVYVTFCLTARDFRAARKMRQEHRQTKQDEVQKQEGPLEHAQGSQNGFVNGRQADAPRSPSRRRPHPSPPEGPEFDVTESNIAGDDVNISEVPAVPIPPSTPKKKKKKKKKTASETDSPTEPPLLPAKSTPSAKKKKKKKISTATADEAIQELN